MGKDAADGPLHGIRILEIASIGPGPFAATLLSAMGADVIRLHRGIDPVSMAMGGVPSDCRGRPAVALDLKSERGRGLALQLATNADALLEGFRPGVMERLGLGPEIALARNPRLVYARVTGYGQNGPLAGTPGHDINYLAIAGVLSAIGQRGQPPTFPLNLLGDYGGGGMLVAFGIACALLEAARSGRGQVVDAAMIDGVAQLASLLFGFVGAGSWGERGTNVLDGGAHFYAVYETSDGGHIAVGAAEPQFYADLLRVLEIPPDEAPQWDRQRWPELRERFAAVFAARTRAQWTERCEGTDACVTPVLSLTEAPTHPHNVARAAFFQDGGVPLPAPAPRFGRTSARANGVAPDVDEVLLNWGISSRDVDALRDAGAFDVQ